MGNGEVKELDTPEITDNFRVPPSKKKLQVSRGSSGCVLRTTMRRELTRGPLMAPGLKGGKPKQRKTWTNGRQGKDSDSSGGADWGER